MNRVVAVLIAYYPERVDNVHKSVAALQNSTRPPDKIIIANNNSQMLFPLIEGVTVINSSHNFQTRAKYGIALLEPADYYILLDDDMTVGRRTIEAFLKYANPNCCMSGWGIHLRNNSYVRGEWVKPENIGGLTRVDSHVGRLQFLSFQAILNMLALEPEIRLDDNEFLYDAEDVLVGLANTATIPPLRGDELPVDLGECGVNMWERIPGYAEMRDRFCLKVLQHVRGR